MSNLKNKIPKQKKVDPEHKDVQDSIEKLLGQKNIDEFATIVGFSSSIYATDDLDIAQNICESGLFIKKNEGLHGIATWLGKDKISAVKSIILKHRGDAYGVIVDIPLQDKSLPIHSIIEKIRRVPNHTTDRLSDILSKSMGNEAETTIENFNPERILPSKWIRGIVDLKTFKFIQNSNYNPYLDEDDVTHIKSYLERIRTEVDVYQNFLSATVRKERRDGNSNS